METAAPGHLYLMRRHSSLGGGSGAAISVWVDGVPKGEILREGQTLSLPLPPGPHRLEVRSPIYRAECDIVIEPGQTVSLTAGQTLSGLEFKPPQESGSSCIIATACAGESSEELGILRAIRDTGISSSPIVRDFFHVFWSRYYEYSPTLARLASSDPNIARHIKWAFLDPWLAWVEFAIQVSPSDPDSVSSSSDTQQAIDRLKLKLSQWLTQMPAQMEGKRPRSDQDLYEAFEHFRAAARQILDNRRSLP